MTNKEWLDYLAQNAPDELAAWFDAEHVEHQERALDGDTSALNAKIAALERKLRISWEYECKFQDERDVLQAEVDTLKVECDDLTSACDDLENELHELTAERDNLKANNQQLHTLAGEQAAMIDELQAQADEKWNLYVAEHRRADINAADREMYREATSALVDSITDGLRKVNSILDGKDEGLA